MVLNPKWPFSVAWIGGANFKVDILLLAAHGMFLGSDPSWSITSLVVFQWRACVDAVVFVGLVAPCWPRPGVTDPPHAAVAFLVTHLAYGRVVFCYRQHNGIFTCLQMMPCCCIVGSAFVVPQSQHLDAQRGRITTSSPTVGECKSWCAANPKVGRRNACGQRMMDALHVLQGAVANSLPIYHVWDVRLYSLLSSCLFSVLLPATRSVDGART